MGYVMPATHQKLLHIFYWFVLNNHAQREILLANLRKIGVNVNTADILRNPEASRHVQHFVNATNRTL